MSKGKEQGRMKIGIFLADDHAVVRDGLRLVLEAQEDLEVLGEAGDGREVLKAVADLQPDVILMDIAMPGLNGIETTRRVRERLPDTEVVILSMHSSSEHIYRALQAGARGYVLKESAGKEVVKAVRTVHGGRRFLSHKIADAVMDEYLREREKRPEDDPFAMLSAREREILQLVVEGKSSAEIADVIALSPKTVETYRSRMMHKLGIGDLATLVKFALEHGLTTRA